MNNEVLKEIADDVGTPSFIYDASTLKENASELAKPELPFGMTVRYAAKANPFPGLIHLFNKKGLHFDASSTYEARNLIEEGVEPKKISLSGQTLEGPLEDVVIEGVLPVATSLHQLEVLHHHGVKELALRVNPGIGSGHSQRTNVGGPASSFGIWHENVPEVLQFAEEKGIRINRLHTHIGSGADPNIWQQTIDLSLGILKTLPDATTLDVGGGYKVARMPDETPTDMQEVLAVFGEALNKFAKNTGREIHLEIEPGTLLVANAGTLLARVEDIVDTGASGYTFLRLNTGMNDIMRPSLYGAQHPIEILNENKEAEEYVLVGHNCESGDILTPAPGEPDAIKPRRLSKASIGDVVAIGGVGAYCASMRAANYNGFPSAKENMI